VSGALPSREAYYRALAAGLPAGALVVTSLGNASYAWARVADRAENFYVEDAMGLALPLALGLAVAQPARPVIVVEGDGGLQMHLGALVTVGAVAPTNLTILVIANGVHAASGGQPLANPALDWAALARACGLAQAETLQAPDAFARALAAALGAPGPRLLALATAPDVEGVEPPAPLNPPAVKQRFLDALGVPFRL
jgi:thiamine pyrophosphate-dependent acetolactate synthase large subunit-like protein